MHSKKKHRIHSKSILSEELQIHYSGDSVWRCITNSEGDYLCDPYNNYDHYEDSYYMEWLKGNKPDLYKLETKNIYYGEGYEYYGLDK